MNFAAEPAGRSPREDPEVRMMVCTAGHVDHGKTQLVHLLTGCETDRLREEKERGLTIELGFAPCVLEEGISIGIVDVPGHERFVRTMAAGVSGIESAILVVAADDGVMPQTVEHVQIMDLLGTRRAVVAITKTDLVNAERVEQVCREVDAFLTDTSLSGSPICPVSSVTLEGLDAFRRCLLERVRAAVLRRHRGAFRMPVERTFRMPGFGLVLSGIPVAGSVAVGDEIEVVPGGFRGRIRGIQRFLKDAAEGGCGQCLALNVPELGKEPVGRGQVVAPPGYLGEMRRILARIRTVGTLGRELRNAEAVRFHAGTADVAAKLYLPGRRSIEPGGACPAFLALEEPVVVAMHDPFLLRMPSPLRTVGGGVVLAASEETRRPPRSQIIDRIEAVERAFRDITPADEAWPQRRVEFFLAEEAGSDAAPADTARGTLLSPSTAREALERAASDGAVLPLAGDRFVHARVYERLRGEAETRIRTAADGALSVDLNDLRRGLPGSQRLWDRIVSDLERDGRIRRQGARVLLPDGARQVEQRAGDLLARVLDVYEETGFQSPRPDELPERLAASAEAVDRVLEHLCNEGRLFRLAKNVVLGKDHLRRARDRVVEIIHERGELDSADFKNEIGSSRKYALAILDWLDARGVTHRNGNLRTLASDYERHVI